MPPTYYRGCWHVVSRGFLVGYRPSAERRPSSPLTGLYAPKRSFTHAASLHQGSPHCAISPTAASRRSLGRVSVPMWPSALSGRLPIEALVGRCPANWLIGRGPIPPRISPFPLWPCGQKGVCGISGRFRPLSPHGRAGCPRVTHPSATRACMNRPKPLQRILPFDLHVLGTPPAFILSQDQTLKIS